MKKCLMTVLLLCFLTGCRSPEAYETMTDLYYTPQPPEPAQITLWLPENGALSVMESEDAGTIYLCDGYSVSLQTLEAGDMDATLCAVTGYAADALRGISWEQNGLSRYECAWATTGEGGDQVGRTVVLDDGAYHYVITVMGQAELAGAMAETWQAIMDSAALDTEP